MQLEWIFKTEPELVQTWETQATNLGMPGYWHIRDSLIAYSSTASVALNVVVDGVTYAYTLPSTGGQRRKSYLPSLPIKGKYLSWEFEASAGMRLYLADCEVRAKAWGSSGEYQTFRPFGDLSFNEGDGARI
jgi:hypothetical protein